MAATFPAIWSTVFSAIEIAIKTLIEGIIDIIADIIAVLGDTLIDPAIFQSVYTEVVSWPGLFLITGFGIAALARKFILTGEKFREDTPVKIGLAWVEDTAIGSIVSYNLAPIFVSIIITPIVFFAGLPGLVARIALNVVPLLVNIVGKLLEMVFEMILQLFKPILDAISIIVETIENLANAIWNGIGDILDALP